MAQAPKKKAHFSQEYRDKVAKAELKVKKSGDQIHIMTEENAKKFVRGEITLAQLQGLTMRQMYAFAAIAHNFLKQGRLDDASKIISGLIVLNPYDPYFHSLMGSVHAKNSQWDQALMDFSIAVNLDSQDPQIYVNRAEILLRKGQFELAMADLKRCVELGGGKKNPAVARARVLAAATARLIEEVIEQKTASK